MMLPIAFADCNDPYAWLLRGLTEYGWEDLTLLPHSFPKQTGLGFDAHHLIDPLSRFGLRLVILPKDSNGQWYRRDGSYEFEVRHVRNLQQQDCILLRSDEMAYSKIFPIVTEHPTYSAGYIHEAISQQVPLFVEKRKRGEAISSIDIQEMLNFPIIAPPPNFIRHIQEQVRFGRDFNQFRHQPVSSQPSAIASQTPAPQPQQAIANPQPVAPSAQNTTTSPQWSIQEGMARGQMLRSNQGLFGQEHSAAIVIIEQAAKMLQWIAGLAIFLGVLAIVNAMFTSYMVSSKTTVRMTDAYTPVIILSFILGIGGCIGGWVSWYSNRFFRELDKKPLFWFPLLFSAIFPLTIVLGLPVAIFALYKWKRPEVQKVFSQ